MGLCKCTGITVIDAPDKTPCTSLYCVNAPYLVMKTADGDPQMCIDSEDTFTLEFADKITFKSGIDKSLAKFYVKEVSNNISNVTIVGTNGNDEVTLSFTPAYDEATSTSDKYATVTYTMTHDNLGDVGYIIIFFDDCSPAEPLPEIEVGAANLSIS